MLRVEEQPMETIHLYVVREEKTKPYSLLPIFCAFLCLVGLAALTLYSGLHPHYEYERLTIPAQFLTPKYFSVSELIIPTGIKTSPATQAHGILTITNGSVIAQELPSGLIFTGNDAAEVITDTSVFVPAGSASGYGFATVSAHTAIGGKIGNIPANDINRVEGSSIYIRNLTPFTGGKDAYSMTYATPQDRLTALSQARATLHQLAPQTMLVRPCTETLTPTDRSITVRYACQNATYSPPVFFRVEAVIVQGSTIVLYGYPLQPPRKIRAK